jgi:LacI family transcriptional regulator/LacI family purine nucleotide synthesis repressor
MKQITVYDIAKEANVSVATVSRVLNGTAPVKASTKLKIMEIMGKHQFQPNALARSLTKKETNMIGMILPDITNPFFPEVFWGAENEAREKGYTFFLCNTSGDYARESEYISVLREKRVDGMIFIGGRINLPKPEPQLVKEVMELAARTPTVLINGSLPGNSLTRVASDEKAGTEMAIEHLIELGHRRIALIGGNDYMTTTIQKVKAYRGILEQKGLEYREEWVRHDDFSVNSGRHLMAELLQLSERPTAVFCINDFVAVGAMKTVIESGLRIPEDISIIGFDDTPLATAVIPELTTVSLRAQELGSLAVEVLHKMMNKEKVRKLTQLEPHLVRRQSTARPPSV